MNKNSIIDGHYRLLKHNGNEGERFGEVWLVEDLNRPGSEPEYMVVSNQRFADKYILIRQLGCGGFGEVWKAKDTVTGVDVALKIHKDGDSVNATNQIVKEYTRVMGIHHDNLLTPTHVNIVGGRTAYLEMELCRRDLADAELTEEEVWKLIHDVASGLKRLAENKKWIEKQQRYVDNPIIHQDIKPANILLRSNGMYAISDFGISKRKLSSLTTNETETQDEGSSPMTIPYAAPERFSGGGGHPELASDIWSLGAMLYEIVEGNLPFADYGGNSLNSGIVRIPSVTRKDYSDELKQLIYDCMAKDPVERPTAAQLLEYAGKTIVGDVRKVTWSGAPKQTKSDPAKRLSLYKSIPWGKKEPPLPPKKKNGFEYDEPVTMYGAPSPFRRNIIKEIIKTQKKRLLALLLIVMAIGVIVIMYPKWNVLFDNAERKAWRDAKQENTLASYRNFIESNGQSKYVGDALVQIARMENAVDNISGLRYVLFNAENVLQKSDSKDTKSLYNAINEEVLDSVNVVLESHKEEAIALENRIKNYTFDRYYSDPTELNMLKCLVNDVILLDLNWYLLTREFGDSNKNDEQIGFMVDEYGNFQKWDLDDNYSSYDEVSIVSCIPHWDEYKDAVSNALITARVSFTQGKRIIGEYLNVTTEEYVEYYKEAMETVNRFFDEVSIGINNAE